MPETDPHIDPQSVGFIPGRYPYTYCADQIRQWASCGMSRSEAARLKKHLAEAIGLSEEEFACKVADEHLRLQGIERPNHGT